MDFLVPRSLERFGIFKWNHEASQLHKAVHRTRCHIDAFHLGQLKIKYPAKFFIAHRRDLRYTAVNEFPADIRFGRFLPLINGLFPAVVSAATNRFPGKISKISEIRKDFHSFSFNVGSAPPHLDIFTSIINVTLYYLPFPFLNVLFHKGIIRVAGFINGEHDTEHRQASIV